MRARKQADHSSTATVVPCAELRRFGENAGAAARGWFLLHGLRIDAHRWLWNRDPMLVLYRDGVEVGQLGEHDYLVIEDGGAVYPLAHADFHATFERDPDWNGGAVGKHRRVA